LGDTAGREGSCNKLSLREKDNGAMGFYKKKKSSYSPFFKKTKDAPLDWLKKKLRDRQFS